MFDIGMTELLVIGLVALIVVGPKDLPGMFRTLGQFTAKAKRMAREFSQAMEQAADDAGVADVQKTLKAATNPAKAAMNSVSDSVKKAVDFDDLDPDSATAKLAKERSEKMDKIRAQAAETAEARKTSAASESKKKPAAKKPAAKPKSKTPAAKKAAPTKTAAKPAAAKKKAAPKKPAAKKADT